MVIVETTLLKLNLLLLEKSLLLE